MSTPAFSQICELLFKLSQDELDQLRKRIRFLLDNKPEIVVSDDTPYIGLVGYDWLLMGIESELKRVGLFNQRGRLPVARLNPEWEEVSAEMRVELSRHLPHLERHNWVAFGVLCAGVLIHYLEAGGIPVGPKTMLNNVDKILLALEAQFPGYLRSGMLRHCLDTDTVGMKSK